MVVWFDNHVGSWYYIHYWCFKRVAFWDPNGHGDVVFGHTVEDGDGAFETEQVDGSFVWFCLFVLRLGGSSTLCVIVDVWKEYVELQKWIVSTFHPGRCRMPAGV